ncbi:glycosyltransferase family 2 protein [Candidatus Dojkabacteria bacterium]|nr:glycosyltransferase family 2 protein [Candidatus Dojkabacteria bacterium]
MLNQVEISKEPTLISGKNHYLLTDKKRLWQCYIDDYVNNLVTEESFDSLYGQIIKKIIIDNLQIFKHKSQEMRLPSVPLVSIIVVNWNGEKYLDDFFNSLLVQTYKNFEVIFVDHASIDNSISIAKSYINKGLDVKIIRRNRNYGFSPGNNLGVLRSKGKVLFLLNNDVKLDENCINNALFAMQTYKCKKLGAIFPKVLFWDRPGVINSLEAKWNHLYQWIDYCNGKIDCNEDNSMKKIFGTIFPAVFIERQTFIDIGLFDNIFFSYAEDMDISYRLNVLGYTNISVPFSFLYHKYRSSSQEKVQTEFSVFWGVRNYLFVLLKNMEFIHLARVFPKFFKRIVVKPMYYSLLNCQYKRFFTYVKIILSAIFYTPYVLFQRWKINKKRVWSDDEFFDPKARENYDIFFFNSKPVISKLSIDSALKGSQKYDVSGIEYETY